MKQTENLTRLLTKFKLRYGEHDTLVKTMQQELDNLNGQSAIPQGESIPKRATSALLQGSLPTTEHS